MKNKSLIILFMSFLLLFTVSCNKYSSLMEDLTNNTAWVNDIDFPESLIYITPNGHLYEYYVTNGNPGYKIRYIREEYTYKIKGNTLILSNPHMVTQTATLTPLTLSINTEPITYKRVTNIDKLMLK